MGQTNKFSRNFTDAKTVLGINGRNQYRFGFIDRDRRTKNRPDWVDVGSQLNPEYYKELPYGPYLNELYNIEMYRTMRPATGNAILNYDNCPFYQLRNKVEYYNSYELNPIQTRYKYETLPEFEGYPVKHPTKINNYIHTHDVNITHDYGDEFVKPYNYFVNHGIDEFNRMLSKSAHLGNYYAEVRYVPSYIKYAVLDLLQGCSVFNISIAFNVISWIMDKRSKYINEWGERYLSIGFIDSQCGQLFARTMHWELIRSGIIKTSGIFAQGRIPMAYTVNEEYLKAVYNKANVPDNFVCEKGSIDEMMKERYDMEPVFVIQTGYSYINDNTNYKKINDFMSKLDFDIDAAMDHLDDFFETGEFMEAYNIGEEIKTPYIKVPLSIQRMMGVERRKMKKAALIEWADEHGLVLVQKKRGGRVMFLDKDNYIDIIKDNIYSSHINSFNSISNYKHVAKVNNTNRRLDHKLTNMHKRYLKFITYEGQPLYSVDLANSQFTILANLMDDNEIHSFIKEQLNKEIGSKKEKLQTDINTLIASASISPIEFGKNKGEHEDSVSKFIETHNNVRDNFEKKNNDIKNKAQVGYKTNKKRNSKFFYSNKDRSVYDVINPDNVYLGNTLTKTLNPVMIDEAFKTSDINTMYDHLYINWMNSLTHVESFEEDLLERRFSITVKKTATRRYIKVKTKYYTKVFDVPSLDCVQWPRELFNEFCCFVCPFLLQDRVKPLADVNVVLSEYDFQLDNINQTDSNLLNKIYQGKFYESIQGNMSRKEAKINAFNLLFSDNRGSRLDDSILGREHPNFVKKVKDYKSKFNSLMKFPVLLQVIESTIFVNNILPRLYRQDIPCVTKHDAILCTGNQLEQVRQIVDNEFVSLGLRGKFHVEIT